MFFIYADFGQTRGETIDLTPHFLKLKLEKIPMLFYLRWFRPNTGRDERFGCVFSKIKIRENFNVFLFTRISMRLIASFFSTISFSNPVKVGRMRIKAFMAPLVALFVYLAFTIFEKNLQGTDAVESSFSKIWMRETYCSIRDSYYFLIILVSFGFVDFQNMKVWENGHI